MPDIGQPKPAAAGPRRRRGRRGGRGRGRGPRPPLASTAATPGPETPTEAPAIIEAVAKVPVENPPITQPQVSANSAISQAIDEVAQVIEALKRALDQMEEVLELTELAERQKTADEQEIESLRRSLRHLQRPGGQRSRGDGEAHG